MKDFNRAKNSNISVLREYKRENMGIDDILREEEDIEWEGRKEVEYGGKWYSIYLTDSRLILYREEGLVFKSDDWVALSLGDIDEVNFRVNGSPEVFIKKEERVISIQCLMVEGAKLISKLRDVI